MRIDDVIEKLNALRAAHGNIEVVLEEQSQRMLAHRDPEFVQQTMFGNPQKHRNYAHNGSSIDDAVQTVVVIRI